MARTEHERSGSRIAQSPEHDLLELRHPRNECFDRGAQVVLDMFECARVARAVPHAPVVESHARSACSSEAAREQRELPVTADAVLRSADHDEDASRSRRLRQGQDAEQALPLALEHERTFHGTRAHSLID
jgi:hypothetical protein